MTTQNPKNKVLSLREAMRWRENLRKKHMKLAFTNGCFDLIHRGHAEYLLKARNLADNLIVALNSDESIRSLKGEGRPICNQKDRAFILASFFFVDAVIIFNESRCAEIIKALMPDIYVKGGDYNIKNINKEEKSALLGCGAKIKFLKFIKGLSTTSIIEKLI